MKILVLFLALSSYLSANNQWVQKLNFEGIAIDAAKPLAHGNLIYVYGGNTEATAGEGLTEMWIYNTQTGHWVQGPSSSGDGRNSYAAVSCGGKFFYIGGFTSQYTADPSMSSILVFDPADATESVYGSWLSSHPIDSLPSTIYLAGVGAVCYDNHIYVHGGWGNRTYSNIAFDNHDSLYKIPVNTSTPTWTTLASSSIYRSFHTMNLIGDKIIITGGLLNAPVDYSPSTESVEIYHISSNVWTSGEPMPTPRYNHSAAVLGGLLYVQGGFDYRPGGYILDTTLVYDPATDTWVDSTPLNSGRVSQGALTMGSEIYVIGGVNAIWEPMIEVFTYGTPQMLGNGEPEHIPKWNQNMELVNSVFVQYNSMIGLGNSTPVVSLDISGDGIRIRDAKTPGSSGTACEAGQISWDSSYIYVCIATNSWKRVSLSSF
ncbi:MAG: hypothetical protein H3C47_05690 [Candidatus Cloacimonetes bacterium]|nr:hypothetical protein [Candidatus Cloacimonadota bacterium]